MTYGDLKVRNLIWNTGSGDNTIVTNTLVTSGANTFTGNQSLGDNIKVQLGAGNDLQLFHDGVRSKINNETGHFYIQNSGSNDDSNIYIRARDDEESIVCFDDASVRLYYDGVQKLETASFGLRASDSIYTDEHLYIDNDTGRIKLGTAADLQLYHDGGSSFIKHDGQGHLYVHAAGTNEDLYLRAADNVHIETQTSDTAINAIGNGGVELYYDNSKKVETYSSGIKLNGTSFVWIQDSGKLICGGGSDLQIYHDGSHSYINNSTGTLHIMGKAGENSIQAQPDGAVELYYDGGKKLETHPNGAKVTGDIHLDDQAYLRYGTSDSSWIQGEDGGSGYLKFGVNNVQMTINRNGTINIPDNNKFTCGASGDLQIYHSGNSSYVRDVGTGTLWLDTNGNDISLISDGSVSNGKMGRFWKDGAVELYYDNSKKFETTSSGITVTGSVTETSDVSLKNNINTIQNPLELIEQIRGINFTWKNNGMKSMGVIAQDVEKVFPELVHGQEGSKTLQYSGLIGALVESVKVLSAKVAALEG